MKNDAGLRNGAAWCSLHLRHAKRDVPDVQPPGLSRHLTADDGNLRGRGSHSGGGGGSQQSYGRDLTRRWGRDGVGQPWDDAADETDNQTLKELSPSYGGKGTITLHSFVLHRCDVLKARRRNIPVFTRLFLSRSPRWAARRRESPHKPVLVTAGVQDWFVFLLVREEPDLCFLCSLEELRRSRLFRSRLRLLFSRLRLPRSLLQLRCLSPRPADPLRLRFLCRSLSLSVDREPPPLNTTKQKSGLQFSDRSLKTQTADSNFSRYNYSAWKVAKYSLSGLNQRWEVTKYIYLSSTFKTNILIVDLLPFTFTLVALLWPIAALKSNFFPLNPLWETL